MTMQIIPTTRNHQAGIISIPEPSTAELTREYFDSLSPNTKRAYRADLENFTRWLQAETLSDGILYLFSLSQGDANRVALRYRNHLVESGFSPATTNRRLTALRSICTYGKYVEYLAFDLRVKNVQHQSYRETKGPGIQNCKKILNHVRSSGGFKGIRNTAIVALLVTLALRRSEIANLNLDDLNLDSEPPTISVMGKGRTERESISVPTVTVGTLTEYLKARGLEPGPLFVSYSHKHTRLTSQTVYNIVRDAARACGIVKAVSPHKIRHTSITTVIESGDIPLQDVMRFARHKNFATTLIYYDAVNDAPLKAATQIENSIFTEDINDAKTQKASA